MKLWTHYPIQIQKWQINNWIHCSFLQAISCYLLHRNHLVSSFPFLLSCSYHSASSAGRTMVAAQCHRRATQRLLFAGSPRTNSPLSDVSHGTVVGSTWSRAWPLACGEEEGVGEITISMVQEHWLQASLFSEKQNNLRDTWSSFVNSGGREYVTAAQNKCSDYSSDYILLSSEIPGVLEAPLLSRGPFFLPDLLLSVLRIFTLPLLTHRSMLPWVC